MNKPAIFFFFKQKTAYEMRISDWSSDVCCSDLPCWKAVPSLVFKRLKLAHRKFQAARGLGQGQPLGFAQLLDGSADALRAVVDIQSGGRSGQEWLVIVLGVVD